MKYVKTYELFGFGSKKSKTWQQKFDDAYNFYLKNKSKKISYIDVIDFPSAIIYDDNSFSFLTNYKDREHLSFHRGNGKLYNYEVIDYKEHIDYKNPKSEKGIYEITREIYEEYLEKAKEVKEWQDKIEEVLDKERSKKRNNRSSKNTFISDDGELNMEMSKSDMEEITMEEISKQVDKELKLKGSEYEFEAKYVKIVSEKEKEIITERLNLKIDDIKFRISMGRTFQCQLITKDPFGVKSEITITEKSTTEYNDLENSKDLSSVRDYLMMFDYRPDMSREQEREYKKEISEKYPRAIYYKLSPSKWKTIEMLKNLTSILKEMNNLLNKK